MADAPANGNGDGASYRITIGVVYELLQAQNRSIVELSTSVKLMDQRLNTALINTKELATALEREREARLAAEKTVNDEVGKLRVKVYGALTTLVLALAGLAAKVGVT